MEGNTVKQLSVFVSNETGTIAKVTRALYDKGVDLRAISVADTEDYGILRLLVSDAALAKACLEEGNYMHDMTDVTVVAVPDVPGGLSMILELMANNGVGIEYMYSLIDRGTSDAYMVFRATDTEELHRILFENGIKTVSGESLGLR